MIKTGTFKLSRKFERQAKGVFNKLDFEVGVLTNKPHRLPRDKSKGFGSFAGGPTRKLGKRSPVSIAEVSESLRRHLKINFYTRPFKSRKNRDVLKFTRSMFLFALKRGGTKRRVENTLQAIVRNPILRGDYGRNKRHTAERKGFNRLMIDTAQLFKNIKARVRRR